MKIKKIFVFILVLPFLLLLTSCEPNQNDKPSYGISLSSIQNGTVTLSSMLAEEGTIITVSVNPDDGYRLVKNSLTYNGIKIENNKFTMPAQNVYINAEFEEIKYSVRIDNIISSYTNENYVTIDHSYDFAYDNIYKPGEIVHLEVYTASGYYLKENSLKYNGKVIKDNSFIMPDCDVVITAEFIEMEKIYQCKLTETSQYVAPGPPCDGFYVSFVSDSQRNEYGFPNILDVYAFDEKGRYYYADFSVIGVTPSGFMRADFDTAKGTYTVENDEVILTSNDEKTITRAKISGKTITFITEKDDGYSHITTTRTYTYHLNSEFFDYTSSEPKEYKISKIKINNEDVTAESSAFTSIINSPSLKYNLRLYKQLKFVDEAEYGILFNSDFLNPSGSYSYAGFSQKGQYLIGVGYYLEVIDENQIVLYFKHITNNKVTPIDWIKIVYEKV